MLTIRTVHLLHPLRYQRQGSQERQARPHDYADRTIPVRRKLRCTSPLRAVRYPDRYSLQGPCYRLICRRQRYVRRCLCFV